MTIAELLKEIEELRKFNDNLDDMEIQVVICDTGFDEAPSYTCGWISNINVEGTTKVLINNKWEFMEEPYIKLFGYEE